MTDEPAKIEVEALADEAFAALMREHDEAVHRAPASLPAPGPDAWWAEVLRPGAVADLARDWLRAPDDTRSPADRGEPLVVASQPGATVTATVWVHETGHASGSLGLVLSDLVSSAGARIPATDAVVAPAAVALPTVGPVPIQVALPVPAAAPSGTYHGWVIAAGFPDVVLPVRVVVA